MLYGKLRRVHPTIELESYEEQQKAGRYNPATVAVYDRKRFTLASGDSDLVTFYRYADLLLVLAENGRFDYIGLGAYSMADGSKIASVFVQDLDNFSQSARLPRCIMDYNSGATKARILGDFIDM